MVLPEGIDAESYIGELESTIEKLTGEIETLRSEIESMKKKLLLYENPHTPPSKQMIKPKIVNPPEREELQLAIKEQHVYTANRMRSFMFPWRNAPNAVLRLEHPYGQRRRPYSTFLLRRM